MCLKAWSLGWRSLRAPHKDSTESLAECECGSARIGHQNFSCRRADIIIAIKKSHASNINRCVMRRPSEVSESSHNFLGCVDISIETNVVNTNFLRELGRRISSAPLNDVLWKIVRFVSDFVNLDSCFLSIV